MLASLDAVGQIMWESDSGAVPVVNPEGKVVGLLTDRDLAMAMAAKNRGASQILVREVVSQELFACTPEEEVVEAIKKMRTNRIRRLPVIDAQGQLLGMLSLKDLALAAKAGSEISFEDVALTLQTVCLPRTEAMPHWPWVNAASR
jgi:CBS domain-containing protein